MTRHVASTRHFPSSGGQLAPSFGNARPCSSWSPVMAPLPVGLNGQPYMGMDPSAPVTWVRPYNPQPGMVARLNFDGAKAQSFTPTGGTWRNPMRDRQDVGRGWARRRRLWRYGG